MRVYTHYPALAPAIKRAGFEPVLLEPLHEEAGPVRAEVTHGCGVTLLEVRAPGSALVFEQSDEGWELVR